MLPPEFITVDYFKKCWSLLKPHFLIQEDTIAQTNHDFSLKAIKGYFSKFKELKITTLDEASRN